MPKLVYPDGYWEAYFKAHEIVPQRKHKLPKGECQYCDDTWFDNMSPYHDASDRCESGKHSHCTCDICY